MSDVYNTNVTQMGCKSISNITQIDNKLRILTKCLAPGPESGEKQGKFVFTTYKSNIVVHNLHVVESPHAWGFGGKAQKKTSFTPARRPG